MSALCSIRDSCVMGLELGRCVGSLGWYRWNVWCLRVSCVVVLELGRWVGVGVMCGICE